MKKTDELSLEKTFEFATQCYASKTTDAGDPLIEHAKKIASQAEVIARKLYQDLRADYMPESTKDSVTAIVHCSLLFDVLNVSSCAFEHIAEVTNVQVAAMVAAISRDYRLVETKRDMEFRGRVSQSPATAQIVVVAIVICTAKALDSALDAVGVGLVPRAKKVLAQLDGDLLAIHSANKYYVIRAYVHAARNMLHDISQKIKACKQKAKIEKMVLQSTKTLRESVEQSKERKPKAKSKEQKKEMRYAGKQNVRKNSE
jgi:(p)ppGpp synthase/HD superfamily hydrolase